MQKKVATYLGTNHHETYISGNEVLDIVPQIAAIYSEPFSDSSQIPTYLVSKIAKQKVTVCLSGDAGDELFGGYSRYRLAAKTWKLMSKIPPNVRNGIRKGTNKIPYDVLQNFLLPLNLISDKEKTKVNFADKVLKATDLLLFETKEKLYGKGFMNHNRDALEWVLESDKINTLFDENAIKIENYYTHMMAVDLVTYLPNNNLAKVDRAAMANSLETRVPFLDHRVVDFALSLPAEYKLRNGVDKWILREVLYKYVPRTLIERPKMGFAVPLAYWLRGPLREWCEHLISEKRLDEDGFFNTTIVRRKWKEHLSGKRNWENQLWDVVIFQSWLDGQKNK